MNVLHHGVDARTKEKRELNADEIKVPFDKFIFELYFSFNCWKCSKKREPNAEEIKVQFDKYIFELYFS